MITTMNSNSSQDPAPLRARDAEDLSQKLPTEAPQPRDSTGLLINRMLEVANKETFVSPQSVVQLSNKEPGVDDIKNLLGDLGISCHRNSASKGDIQRSINLEKPNAVTKLKGLESLELLTLMAI